MKIKLYHGTSEKNYQLIKQQGFLNSGYLTCDAEQAQYYAECASEEDNTNEVILKVEVNTDDLIADIPSHNEPLSYILKNHGLNEEDWHKSLNDGEIKYPSEKDWHISLENVKCILNKANTPFENIVYDGCLSSQDNEDIEKAILIEYSKKTKLQP